MIAEIKSALRNAHGFTLIEILVAIVILGMVLSSVYAAYSGTMKIIQEIEYENNVYRMARVVLDRMIKDLPSIQPLNGKYEIRTNKELIKNHEFTSLSFWAAAHLAFDDDQEVDGSMAMIGYYPEEDTDGTFVLRRSDQTDFRVIKDKNAGGSYIICRNVDSLIVKFYDSAGKEYDSWDSSSNSDGQKGNTLAAIKIELNIVNAGDKDKPYKFMTKILLPANL